MLVAIFDGRCVICNTTRAIIRRVDWFNRITFLDLHDREEIESRFPWLNHEQAMGEIHVVDDKGKVFAGFRGTRRMLREIPIGWPLWILLHIPLIGNWLGSRLYRFIAKNRYAINRLMGVDLNTVSTSDNCDNDGLCKIPQQ